MRVTDHGLNHDICPAIGSTVFLLFSLRCYTLVKFIMIFTLH